jgi:mannose-6-phosphate isomerase-like protein (cupin superfamily)
MNEIRAESASDNGNRRIIRAFGQEGHVLVSSQETGDAFCILRIFASANSITPPHVHPETDETFLIESGEVEVNRGGELIRGQKGDVIFLPRGVPHAPKAFGTENLTILVICGSSRRAEKNSKKKSLTFRFWTNWRVNTVLSSWPLHQADPRANQSIRSGSRASPTQICGIAGGSPRANEQEYYQNVHSVISRFRSCSISATAFLICGCGAFRSNSAESLTRSSFIAATRRPST